jgi:DNA-binding NtrC family response regulator
MPPMRQALLVDDDVLFCDSVKLLLESEGVSVDLAHDGATAVQFFEQPKEYGIIVLDLDLPGETGDLLARRARKLRPYTPILFSTGQVSSESLRRLLESGASQGFFAKGQSLHLLKDKILSLVDRYMTKQRVLKPEDARETPSLTGSSQPLQRAREQLRRYKSLLEPVLLLGESGTGKELAAKALHCEGTSWTAINCAKFLNQEGLLESELFGHVKGSFTGAHQDQKGLLEEAAGGTLFLDEVHALSLASQQKLLRVLQEQKYRRVGDVKERVLPAKFRLVAAAKDDLFERVQRGSFLADFYFRIHTLTIELPPLRERLEDLESLCVTLLAELSRQLGRKVGIRAKTLGIMKTYSWPGNVRELKSCLYRMAVDSAADVLEPADFNRYLCQTGSKLTGELTFQDGVRYKDYVREVEIKYFRSILAECTSREEVLERTGISKSTLYRKLMELGLELSAEERVLYSASSH